MQVQGKDSAVSSYIRFNGPLDCALNTIKSEGFAGMFRGGVATLMRESIGNAAFFATYESGRHYMHSMLRRPRPPESRAAKLLQDAGIGIVTGGISGMAIYRRVGLRGCYAGLGPTLVRAFPANAAAIVTWELAAKMLGVGRE